MRFFTVFHCFSIILPLFPSLLFTFSITFPIILSLSPSFSLRRHHPDHRPEGERPAAEVRTQKIVAAYSELKPQAK